MNTLMSVPTEVTFDQVLALALRLRPLDQARLVVRLAPRMEAIIDQVQPSLKNTARRPLRGMLADLGPAPSAEEIEAAQAAIWESH